MTIAPDQPHSDVVGDSIANFIDRLSPRLSLALIIAASTLVLLINPIGYLGGGYDDTHYVVAARCWVAANAACLPPNHWWSRWPLVAPMALVTGLLGESRATVGLVPLAYWIAGIALLGWLGRLWVDRASGLVAALVLASLPIYSESALQPSIDSTELAWQLAALVAATAAYRRQSRAIALLAGVLAGMAMMSRDTTILFLGASALGWLLLDRSRRPVLLLAIAGLAMAVGAEIIVYAVATGDPLFRYRLSLHHVAIPSAELPAGFDISQQPLFNPAYIAAWKREANIHYFWIIDPWLNLLASRRIGFVLTFAALIAAVFGRYLPRPARITLGRIAAFAFLVAFLLIYGLAIDPKPRMFLLLASAMALVGGAVSVAAWRAGRGLIPSALILSIWLMALWSQQRLVRYANGEARAADWIKRYPGQLEIDSAARSMMLLVPGIDTVAPAHSGRPLRIGAALEGCAALLASAPGAKPTAVVIDHVGQAIGPPADLCLYRYTKASVEAR